MKTQKILLLVGFLSLFTLISPAQNDSLTNFSKNVNIDSQKGKFHVAIQKLSITDILAMKTTRSVSLRAGYMISDHDLLYIDGLFSIYPRENIDRTFQLNVNYRRYFGNSVFRPFVQSGLGFGHVNFSDDYYSGTQAKFYGIFKFGGGVSYQYKRWGFEVGMQTDFNHHSTGRFQIRPIWGISYSF